jgi:hypothetical protein
MNQRGFFTGFSWNTFLLGLLVGIGLCVVGSWIALDSSAIVFYQAKELQTIEAGEFVAAYREGKRTRVVIYAENGELKKVIQ